MKESRVIMIKNRLERLTQEREEEATMIKILLVEDDLGLSNSVFDFLDDFADVMQVFDGEEGLYEAESGIYDLILLDLLEESWFPSCCPPDCFMPFSGTFP